MQFNPSTWTRKAKNADRLSRLKLPNFTGDTSALKIQPRVIKNRTGLDDLIKYVGSNAGREIYQARHLSNKPLFEEWRSGLNENHHAKKWTCSLKDEDGDDVDEFLVKDKSGRTVAVNGFTTRASDYPIETEYYTAFPTKAEREEHPMREFLAAKYKDNMQIDPRTGLPNYDFYDWRATENRKSKYNKRIPQMTPRNVFMETFVWSVSREYIDELIMQTIKRRFKDFKDRSNSEQKKLIADVRSALNASLKSLKQGWLLDFGSQLYTHYVKIPVLQRLANIAADEKGNSALAVYQNAFVNTKTYSDYAQSPELLEQKFVDYVMTKADVKKIVYKVAEMVLDHEGSMYREIMETAKSFIKETIDTARGVGKKSSGRPSRAPSPSVQFSDVPALTMSEDGE